MTITSKIQNKIIKQGRGWVFTPRDFLNIRHFNTVNPLLDRIENRGLIRSLGGGLYDYPIIDPDTGLPRNPKIEIVIKAVEKQLNDKFQFSGAYACVLLGLTRQMPAELKYLSNKQNRVVYAAGFKIKIAQTIIPTPRNKYDKGTLAIQAIKHIGKTKLTLGQLKHIKKQLNEAELKKLKKLANNVSWIKRIV